MLSEQLEKTIKRALSYANDRQHQYATLEHFLLALLDDKDAAILVDQTKLLNNEIKKSVFQVLFNNNLTSKLSNNAYSLLIKNSTEKIKKEIMTLLSSTKDKSQIC